MQNNRETLLRVEHLCQYFGPTKAVDDVSFEIYKGEVFGLVGESGCGKTTIGRSIIKLYDITSGEVYFKGVRIAAGKRSCKLAIKAAKEDYNKQITELKKQLSENAITADEYKSREAELRKTRNSIIAEQRKQIKAANHDQKRCDKEYAAKLVEELNADYQPRIQAASDEEKAVLIAEYKNELRKAKRTRLVTQIQMIFQDPSPLWTPV